MMHLPWQPKYTHNNIRQSEWSNRLKYSLVPTACLKIIILESKWPPAGPTRLGGGGGGGGYWYKVPGPSGPKGHPGPAMFVTEAAA